MSKKTHLLHYLTLLLIFIGGAVGFWRFRVSPTLQFLDVCLVVIGYWIWGFTHHYLEGRLKTVVIIEYLLVGLTVLGLFSLVLFSR